MAFFFFYPAHESCGRGLSFEPLREPARDGNLPQRTFHGQQQSQAEGPLPCLLPNDSPPSLIPLHQQIPLDRVPKLLPALPAQRRRVRPRLGADLLPHDARETARPPPPRKRPVHVVPRRRVHQVRARPHVVVDGRQLQQLAQEGDGAGLAQVLVADDGLADGLGLRRGRGEGCRREQVQRRDGAAELEGQPCRRE